VQDSGQRGLADAYGQPEVGLGWLIKVSVMPTLAASTCSAASSAGTLSRPWAAAVNRSRNAACARSGDGTGLSRLDAAVEQRVERRVLQPEPHVPVPALAQVVQRVAESRPPCTG
jgi:hypothetical protein